MVYRQLPKLWFVISRNRKQDVGLDVDGTANKTLPGPKVGRFYMVKSAGPLRAASQLAGTGVRE